jgi:tetratricopeptide (TPR) repeat protein
MGAVYEAEHVDLQKRVALKVLLSTSARDPKRVAGFLHEARTASRIGSPHIADVTDFGELPDGRVYFVMEYLEGFSLGELLRRGGALSAERALPILRQIAKALGATHEKGVIHLDVKPDNVMLLNSGRREDYVKVVDFGIAGFLEDVRPGAKTISGTPEYVSPERITAKGYDHRADVYGLGVVAYEMLTGSPPFRGADSVETLRLHVEKTPESFLTRAPSLKVPAVLESVVMRLLAKRPDDRPSSMAEVEGLLCEAQIASGFATQWDDLELPTVDAVWRKSLAERMPSAGSRKLRMVVIGTTGIAVLAASLALYFGVIRGRQIVYTPVRVEVTGTDEAPLVAANLVRANTAVKRLQYVTPLGSSALDYIVGAEDEAKKLGRQSPGARLLRENYAAALQAMGMELEQVELGDLAVVKFRDALRFMPNDATLLRKAHLSAEDAALFADRPNWQAHEEASSDVRRLAADVFVAARRGHISEARLAIRALSKADTGGLEAAQLADGLRRLADESWGGGKVEQARPLYQVIAGLDPADRGAALRAEALPPVQPPAEAPVAQLFIKPAPSKSTGVEPKVASHDVVASKREADEAFVLLHSMRLEAAEKSFNRAIAADPNNARALQGLAEVCFERSRYEDALQYSRFAARLSPKSASAQKLLGDANFKLLRFSEALTAYRAAKALSPNDTAIADRLTQAEAKFK